MPRVSTLNYQSSCHQQIQHLRLLTLLNFSFSEQQESSLQDYVETSIMLQYNKHRIISICRVLL